MKCAFRPYEENPVIIYNKNLILMVPKNQIPAEKASSCAQTTAESEATAAACIFPDDNDKTQFMSAATPQNLPDSVRAAIAAQLEKDIGPGLHIVSTPIGNLADVTLRALCVIAKADHILCEDTRQTQKLLSHYQIRVRLTPYHDHNAERSRPRIMAWLKEGASVALVSDAGTPLISDPGYKLVREAAAAGYAVFSVPGPSAVLAALTSSGLPTDSFHFAGFLPSRPAAAQKRLESLAAIPSTLILFETAKRIGRTLDAVAQAMPGRDIVIARELTKRFEEIIRIRPGEKPPPENWQGEIAVLIAPPGEAGTDWDAISDALRSALAGGRLKDAVEEVARTFGVQKKQVYNLALQMRDQNYERNGEKT